MVGLTPPVSSIITAKSFRHKSYARDWSSSLHIVTYWLAWQGAFAGGPRTSEATCGGQAHHRAATAALGSSWRRRLQREQTRPRSSARSVQVHDHGAKPADRELGESGRPVESRRRQSAGQVRRRDRRRRRASGLPIVARVADRRSLPPRGSALLAFHD